MDSTFRADRPRGPLYIVLVARGEGSCLAAIMDADEKRSASPGERVLTQGEAVAVKLAERYVGAYNDRDLDAMLAVQDPSVTSFPAALFGHRPHTGHAGVREWWQAMVDSGMWFTVVVNEVRQLDSDRVAILGELRSENGKPLSPWGVLVRVGNGLIIESRSYLSEKALLEELGVLGEPPIASLTLGSQPQRLRHVPELPELIDSATARASGPRRLRKFVAPGGRH